jgi:hypothetical protein
MSDLVSIIYADVEFACDHVTISRKVAHAKCRSNGR